MVFVPCAGPSQLPQFCEGRVSRAAELAQDTLAPETRCVSSASHLIAALYLSSFCHGVRVANLHAFYRGFTVVQWDWWMRQG